MVVKRLGNHHISILWYFHAPTKALIPVYWCFCVVKDVCYHALHTGRLLNQEDSLEISLLHRTGAVGRSFLLLPIGCNVKYACMWVLGSAQDASVKARHEKKRTGCIILTGWTTWKPLYWVKYCTVGNCQICVSSSKVWVCICLCSTVCLSLMCVGGCVIPFVASTNMHTYQCTSVHIACDPW